MARLSIPGWVVAVIVVVIPVTADAHGLVGKRFLPATLATDDPFVSDELSLPTVQHIKRPAGEEGPATRETELSAEFTKRLTPDFAVGLGGTYRILDPDGGPTVKGFDNLEVTLKYVLWKNAEHEAIVSAGLAWDVGGTGQKKVGAESFDTVTPQLFLGKGFGDLPDSLEFVKPLALTAAVGLAIPTRGHNKTIVTDPDTGDVDVEKEANPNIFQFGGSVQYSLQYLQSYVRDLGLPAPFNRMIPLVEFAMQMPTQTRTAGRITGTINPGIIWFGRYFQLGLEAVIPVNARTGKNVGVLAQVHFFLDDILPQVFTWTPFHGTLGPAVPR